MLGRERSNGRTFRILMTLRGTISPGVVNILGTRLARGITSPHSIDFNRLHSNRSSAIYAKFPKSIAVVLTRIKDVEYRIPQYVNQCTKCHSWGNNGCVNG